MKIKKFTDYKPKSGFNEIELALLDYNNIDISEFEKLFPDYGRNVRINNFLTHDMTWLKETETFIKFIESHKNDKISIVGDYDTDGIMGTVILMIGLQAYGIDCNFIIPDRLKDGFGIKNKHVKEAISRGSKAIITVDNGIAAHKVVRYAKNKGIDVLITDHHIPDEETVPKGVSIINPLYNDDVYPEISGGYVAFKLIYNLLLRNDLFTGDNKFLDRDLLFFAAISTIGDMMPLVGENRLLVKSALQLLQMIKDKNVWNGRILKTVTALGGRYNIRNKDKLIQLDLISFSMSPTINSVGRMEGDVTSLVQDILDCNVGGVYMKDYTKINNSRKKATIDILKTIKLDKRDVYVIDIKTKFSFEIKGLLGLVANRISSEKNKPAFVGMKSGNKFICSARGCDGYSLYDAIERVKKKLPELNITGGGHESAMGIQFDYSEENIKLFEKTLTKDFEINFLDFEAEKVYIEYDPELFEMLIDVYYNFDVFGTKFKRLDFIYSGSLKYIDTAKKVFKVGDLYFKYFTSPPNIKIGRVINVIFDIGTDDATAIYLIYKDANIIKKGSDNE